MYEVDNPTNDEDPLATMGSLAMVFVSWKDLKKESSKIAYNGAVARQLSRNSVNALGIALSAKARKIKVEFANGVADMEKLIEIINLPDYKGHNIATLNDVCSNMCLPWRYKEEAKVAHCVRHLHTYFRFITNISWSAIEGFHRYVVQPNVLGIRIYLIF